MLAHRLIERKRDGGRIEPGEWRALALAYARGHIPDYQMAAFLMACYLRGLDWGETSALTDAMIGSGEKRMIAGSASASSIFGTATRAISQPALARAAI